MYLVRPQRFRVQLSRLGITCRRQHFSYLRLNKVRPHLPMRRPHWPLSTMTPRQQVFTNGLSINIPAQHNGLLRMR